MRFCGILTTNGRYVVKCSGQIIQSVLEELNCLLSMRDQDLLTVCGQLFSGYQHDDAMNIMKAIIPLNSQCRDRRSIKTQ